jgi:hypothetical protein
MPIKRKVSPPIPDGYVIHSWNSVAGIQQKKKAALKFAKNRNQSLEFEREPDNKQDSNAIKIIGCSKRLVFADRDTIGYVPRELASCIVEGGFWGSVEPRLRRIHVGKDEYIEVEFQLLGPREQKKAFNDFLQDIEDRKLEGRPATVWQKEFYRTFDLNVPKGLTYLAARQFINEKSAEIGKEDQGALQAWECYGDIVKELLHPQTRETYDIRAVSISRLRLVVIALLDEGHTMESMHRDIGVVVDKLIEVNQNLELE